MVVCVESYMGAVGEHDGVKLEQQVLITENGFEMLTTYPLEENLLSWFPLKGKIIVVSTIYQSAAKHPAPSRTVST